MKLIKLEHDDVAGNTRPHAKVYVGKPLPLLAAVACAGLQMLAPYLSLKTLKDRRGAAMLNSPSPGVDTREIRPNAGAKQKRGDAIRYRSE